MNHRKAYLRDSDHGGSNMVRIRLTSDDLGEFFTLDSEGHRLTLKSFIEREEMHHHEESAGFSGPEPGLVSDEEPNFSAEDINELVRVYLRSMPEEDVLEIAGSGSFDRDQLLSEVEARTSVGLQIIEMILADRSFVERQIRRGYKRGYYIED